MREHPLSDYADDAANKNAGAHQKSRLAGAFACAAFLNTRAGKAAGAFTHYRNRLARNL